MTDYSHLQSTEAQDLLYPRSCECAYRGPGCVICVNFNRGYHDGLEEGEELAWALIVLAERLDWIGCDSCDLPEEYAANGVDMHGQDGACELCRAIDLALRVKGATA